MSFSQTVGWLGREGAEVSGRMGEDQVGSGEEGFQPFLKMDIFLRALGSHRGL